MCSYQLPALILLAGRNILRNINTNSGDNIIARKNEPQKPVRLVLPIIPQIILKMIQPAINTGLNNMLTIISN
jgi:hypothetical protein